ncbi:MAG TPA: glycan-binding surface protein [Paludibacter sp.]|nr:glycan-binding surface protein [Paludibacter sp.]
MKKTYKSTIKMVISLVVLVALVAVPACNDNPDEYKIASGVPSVSYVRIPDVLKSDSLVTHAFMGTTIALVGENLRSVKEVWFNDQQAVLNTSLITPTALIVQVPNTIPDKVSSKIYLVTASNDTVKYDFGVDVPSPLLNGMDCEYVAEGENAVINGNFFLPVDGSTLPEVYFTPNIKAEVVSVTIHKITVKVPAGAGVGPISVKSRYGTTRSKAFYFRDNRGMILDWDNTNASGGWRAGNIANTNPAGISGNYVRFTGNLDDSGGAGSTWNEDGFSFNLWGISNGRPQGDLFTVDPAKAVLKFEVNVDKPWSSCALQMIFTPWGTSGTNSYIADGTTPRALWNPWSTADKGVFKTDGWITVSVPLKGFKYDHTGKLLKMADAGNYGGLTFFVYHGGVVGTAACSPDICIDNIRVVAAE